VGRSEASSADIAAVTTASKPSVPRETIAEALKRDAATVVTRYFPDAPALYSKRDWRLPTSITRVHDASKAQRVLGFRCETDFGRVLDALRAGRTLPFAHEPAYLSPKGWLAPG